MIFIFLFHIFTPGIHAAREAYKQLRQQPSNSLEFHKKMAALEYVQPEPSIKHVRHPYSAATQCFGANNTSVWIDLIKFEMKHGEPERVGKVYMKAVKMLDSRLTNTFMTEYSLIAAKHDAIK